MDPMNHGKTRITIGLLAILLSLGVADALLTVDQHPWTATVVEVPEPPSTKEPPVDPGTDLPPAGGVRKQQGPNVDQLIADQGLAASESTEHTFLGAIIPAEKAEVHSRALLLDGDRAGSITWTESPQIKIEFLALKEALHEAFSPELRDLIDETQQREGKPPRNFLSFFDPALSDERFLFVRVRDKLYELHVAERGEEALFALIDTLTD